jgi:hypothetical protein
LRLDVEDRFLTDREVTRQVVGRQRWRGRKQTDQQRVMIGGAESMAGVKIY